LIGHEGAGSILSLLKKKGWANELGAGPYHGGIGFGFFKVTIDLTESGLGKIFYLETLIFTINFKIMTSLLLNLFNLT